MHHLSLRKTGFDFFFKFHWITFDPTGELNNYARPKTVIKLGSCEVRRWTRALRKRMDVVTPRGHFSSRCARTRQVYSLPHLVVLLERFQHIFHVPYRWERFLNTDGKKKRKMLSCLSLKDFSGTGIWAILSCHTMCFLALKSFIPRVAQCEVKQCLIRVSVSLLYLSGILVCSIQVSGG